MSLKSLWPHVRRDACKSEVRETTMVKHEVAQGSQHTKLY